MREGFFLASYPVAVVCGQDQPVNAAVSVADVGDRGVTRLVYVPVQAGTLLWLRQGVDAVVPVEDAPCADPVSTVRSKSSNGFTIATVRGLSGSGPLRATKASNKGLTFSHPGPGTNRPRRTAGHSRTHSAHRAGCHPAEAATASRPAPSSTTQPRTHPRSAQPPGQTAF